MNLPPISQAGPPIMQPIMQQQPGTPQGQQNMPGQPQMQQQPAQEKLDNISKVKSLVGQLRETLILTLKTAANTLVQNNLVDVGNMKQCMVAPRFDKVLEEFYSICDQMELHLKTAAECLNQGSSSQRYLPLMVNQTRLEPLPGQDGNQLTYPQYLATVRAQVMYAKEIHDMLLAAAQNIQNTSAAE
ncbi:hypothetical protein LSTR_LSTR009847 [Laodelphax striatellus]|uniref:Mediator of RNA polymerase II transcription subunit 29 n=1 Tax=Laodelphax striatellus TaxID=195883 RepID=A0A482XRS5_LAOST|nr:hypothetical protein LSTR_LSTR009847 [Laodelphax striatellus]